MDRSFRWIVFATVFCLAISAQDLILKQEFSVSRGWSSNNVFPRLFADVNGDGKRDIIGFASDGVWVSLFGSSWVPARPTKWLSGYAVNAGNWTDSDKFPRFAADVNGDNRADIIGFGNDGVYVSLSNGKEFSAPAKWLAQFSIAQSWASQNITPRFIGDVNGDRKADIVGFSSDGVYVSLSTGTGFNPMTKVSDEFKPTSGFANQEFFPRMLGDANGDGIGDLIGFASNGVWVALSNGTTFAKATNWGQQYPAAEGQSTNIEPRMISDMNGDGKGDMVAIQKDGIYVALSSGTSFGAPTRWCDRMTVLGGGWITQDKFPRLLGDFDGDGLADVIGFAGDGIYVSRNTGKGAFATSTTVTSSNTTTTATTMSAPLIMDPPTTVTLSTQDLLLPMPPPPPNPWTEYDQRIKDESRAFGSGAYLSPLPKMTEKGVIECLDNCGSETFADYAGKPVLDSTQTLVCPASVNPQPDGFRRPGVPFLSVRDNACYACPVTDAQGKTLITEADGVDSTPASASARQSALAAGKNIYGGPVCKITQRGKPGTLTIGFYDVTQRYFPQPGMSGMRTFPLILERKLFDNPEALTTAIDVIGKSKYPNNYNRAAYQAQEWASIAQAPFNHEAVRAVVLNMLLVAAAKPNRTPAEEALVTDMQNYIKTVRTYQAKVALDYYDSWNYLWNQRAAQTKRYAFYDLSPRGAVPADYPSAIAGGAAVGATGLAVAAAAGAVAAYSAAIVGTNLTTYGLSAIVGVGSAYASATSSVNLSIGITNLVRTAFSGGASAGAAGFALAGPAIVVTAATAILSAWVSQWQAIENARPTLVLGVVTASTLPVDLRQMVATETGAAQITNYWAMAMDVRDSENWTVMEMAQKAAAAAKASNYAAPK